MVVGDIYDHSNRNKINFYCCLTSLHIESAELDTFQTLLDIRMNLAERKFIVFLRAHNSYYNSRDYTTQILQINDQRTASGIITIIRQDIALPARKIRNEGRPVKIRRASSGRTLAASSGTKWQKRSYHIPKTFTINTMGVLWSIRSRCCTERLVK
ncbi:hypothetical protein TcasGA2_TC000654 [Tribolium castaneum]|uniref:Uncharacterized protein n=1 Tax=Tribolium castaneum TaxID=7070 RepID=D6W922_TRICA|nr:hypothetical protein TcasGA2_TC000654 [Tribolium castaneum]